MASLRKQHEKLTGENLPLTTWDFIAEEKITAEKKTGVRHFIKRIDMSKGFELDNLYLHEIKKSKANKYGND